MKDELLHECGVNYFRCYYNGSDASAFRKFEYFRIHIPTKTRSKDYVYCLSHYDFLKLIDFWNKGSDEWGYISITLC